MRHLAAYLPVMNLTSTFPSSLPKLVAAVAVALSPVLAFAEAPLAERVPASSVVYVGWAGSEAFAAAAEGTDAGELLAKTKVDEVYTVLLPRVIDRIGQVAGPEFDRDVADDILGLVRGASEHPTAFFFGGVTINPDDGETLPKLGIIVKAGEQGAADLRQRVQNLATASGDMTAVFLTRVDGEHFLMYVGYTDLEMGLNLAGEEAGLAASERFEAAMEGVGADQLAVYADGQELMALLNKAIDEEGDPDLRENWPTVRDQLGLDGVSTIAAGGAMRDGAWHTRSLVALDGERRGLFAGAREQTIDEAVLKAVPADARTLQVVSFDLGGALDTFRQTVAAIDPDADAEIGQGLAVANVFVGANVERDVLRNLGDEWAVYQSQSVLPGLGGFVAVNKLKDAAKGERALMMMSTAVVNGVRSQIGEPDVTLNGRSAEIDGVEVYYLGTPLVSPSWAVNDDGLLFAGLYPQSVAAAVNAAEAKGSILDNGSVQQALALADGGGGASGLSFADLPATTPDAYAGWLAVARLIDGGADMFRVEPIGPILPTLPSILQHVTPAYGASWSDDAGWRTHSVSPFPGAAGVLQTQQSAAGYVAIQMLPALPLLGQELGGARETADKVQSASNLRQIGLGAILFADANGGRMPNDLGEILATQDITVEVFLNPRVGDDLPVLPAGDAEAMAEWASNDSDYEWVGDGLTWEAGADTILAYEKPAGLEQGINVLFADGHVEFLTYAELPDRFARSNDARRRAGLDPVDVPMGF